MGEKKGPAARLLRRAAKVGDAVTGPCGRAEADGQARLPVPQAHRAPWASRCPTSRRSSAPTTTPTGLARPLAKAARTAIHRGPLQAGGQGHRHPEVVGVDRLADLTKARRRRPAVIFAPNHHSHLDTLLMVGRRARAVAQGKLMVAAAADYFFDKRWKGARRRSR
jgi:hypothetical protein